jgi:hypothetical protein
VAEKAPPDQQGVVPPLGQHAGPHHAVGAGVLGEELCLTESTPSLLSCSGGSGLFLVIPAKEGEAGTTMPPRGVQQQVGGVHQKLQQRRLRLGLREAVRKKFEPAAAMQRKLRKYIYCYIG